MRHFICVFSFLSIVTVSFAQEYQVVGRVVDAANGAPVEFATVTLLNTSTSDILDGVVTDVGGRFNFEVSFAEIEVEVSFIGYQTIKVAAPVAVDRRLDFGDISLSTDAQMLNEVVVTAEKSTTEYRLDKRVFNVGKDLSTTGASALDILNNVPSVNVSIEGDITLRGSGGVQVLIDGKPSVLADDGNGLGSITADMIAQIEVITNPGAKYDAEGTSGILNIVLKKEERKGVNGSITLNTGIPQNHSLGFSINRRSDKFNFFSQLGLGYRELPNESETSTTSATTGVTIASVGEEFRNEEFYSFRLGADYYFDKLNVLTLSGRIAYEVEDQPSETAFERLDQGGVVEQRWSRSEETSATNPKVQYELQYSREHKDDKDRKLLFSAIGNYFGKEQSSRFVNDITLGPDNIPDQQTATTFEEGKYTFKLDYTRPLSEQWTIESGAQYLINDVSNEFEVNNEVDGDLVPDPSLTNTFEYEQRVLGVYISGSYEKDAWGVKAGLRGEDTDLRTFLVDTEQSNNQRFLSYFPSGSVSYKLTQATSLQGGYSRRIYRPRLWDLNPFFNIRNNFNFRTGNPDLLPEFTDSYEAGVITILGQTSINVAVFHRFTDAVIERVATFSDDVTIVLPVNLGTNRSTGVEINAKYSPSKKVTLTGDANYNVFTRRGQLSDQSFDFEADRWSGKLTTKYKHSKALEAEITTRYESRVQTVQGRLSPIAHVDLGMRYKILDGRGVFNLSVRDAFRSRIRKSQVDQIAFSSISRRLRGRFITLGFSFGFGKGEAMQYSSGRRR